MNWEMRGTFPIEWGYGNNTIWDEYFDIAFTVTNCVVLFLTSFVGIAANFFVTWAVYHQKSLRTWNNALLVNLAIIDILRCAIDCPILITIVLSGPGSRLDLDRVEELLCDAQLVSFSFGCCIQLVTLACISVERYLAVAHPFQIDQRRIRVLVLIPLTWIVAIFVALLCFTCVKDSPVYVKCRGLPVEALTTYDTFGLYVLIPLWSICLAVITGFYARIFSLVKAHNRKIFDKGSFPPPKQDDNIKSARENVVEVVYKGGKTGHDEPEKDKTEEGLVKVEQMLPDERQLSSKDTAAGPTDRTKDQHGATNGSSDNKTWSKNPGDKVESSPNKGGIFFAPQVDNPNPNAEALKLMDLEELKDGSSRGPQSFGDAKADEVSSLPTGEVQISSNDPDPTAANQNAEVVGAVCMMPSFVNKERAKKNKENKLAKRSGYIILTFLIFWTPMIVTVLLNVFIYNNRHSATKTVQDLEVLSVSVACMTSASNPITYAVVNPQFRTQFYHLKNKCKSFWTRN